MRSPDLCALGAASMPTRDLLAIALRHRASDDELAAAERALSLYGDARHAALRSHQAGPALLAILELGRRAWQLPSPAGRRVCSPSDVAAVVAPRAVEGEMGGDDFFLLALDVRLTLARFTRLPADSGALWRCALAAGAQRVVVATRRPGSGAPDAKERAAAERLLAAARVVEVPLLDFVILGDDGYSSFRRLGLIPSTDPRYQ